MLGRDQDRDRRRPVGALLLAVLAVLLAAASAVLWVGTRSTDADAARRADALTAARQGADLEQRVAETKQVVLKNRAVARGVPVDAGLITMNGDQAAAIVAVDSTVSSAGGAPTTRRYRFQLDLSRVGNRWLVANLTAVGLTA
jgi:hypothetical protein